MSSAGATVTELSALKSEREGNTPRGVSHRLKWYSGNSFSAPWVDSAFTQILVGRSVSLECSILKLYRKTNDYQPRFAARTSWTPREETHH